MRVTTLTTLNVTFPADMRPEQVQEFLRRVGAISVTVQPEDVHALMPASDQAPVRDLLVKKLVDAEVPAGELLPVVREWRDSLRVTPGEMDEAQEQAAYEKSIKGV